MITLWVRKGDAACEDAQRFLRQHKYGADQVRDLAAPAREDLAAMAKVLGVAWALVDHKHPSYGDLLPRGAEDMDEGDLLALLAANPALLKAPVLVTPKGGLAGFRERKWMDFLDIGKGRS